MKHVLFDRIEWLNEKNDLHRIDGPAVEYTNGHKEWWQNGKLHRNDGPALEYANGSKRWYWYGKCHRENGPAMEDPSGYKGWFKMDKLHRNDGPAVEYANGTRHWYQDGLHHRLDGPAREYESGAKEWVFRGKENRFHSEGMLKLAIDILENINDIIKEYDFENLDEGEIFLLRLTIKNHFPQFIDAMERILILQ